MLISFIVVGLCMSFASNFISSDFGVGSMIFGLLSLPGAVFIVWTWSISEGLNNQGSQGFILAYLGNIVLIPAVMMGYAILANHLIDKFSLPGWLEMTLLMTWFGPLVLTVFYWVAAPFVAAFALEDDYAKMGLSGPTDATLFTLALVGIFVGGLMWWLNIRFYRKLFIH